MTSTVDVENSGNCNIHIHDNNNHGVYLPRRRYVTTNNNNNSVASQQQQQQQQLVPLRIGIFGGSFNPIHLGHTLLAITAQQTQPIDQVVLVPVYKHAKKRNLLPFHDRVTMCQLSIQPFTTNTTNTTNTTTTTSTSTTNMNNNNENIIIVSTIEEYVGASNGKMIAGLKQLYPNDTKFYYICGDDFFRWMEKPIGIETVANVDGLIVQRRLHKEENSSTSNDKFYKEPFDEQRIRGLCAQRNLSIDFIYGELPHFSSTLVRGSNNNTSIDSTGSSTSSSSWKSFLSSSVVQYLEDHPHLLELLYDNKEQQQQLLQDPTILPITSNKEKDDKNSLTSDIVKHKKVKLSHDREGGSIDTVDTVFEVSTIKPALAPVDDVHNDVTTTSTITTTHNNDDAITAASEWIMYGLDMIHCLQLERGRSGIVLSLGTDIAVQNLQHQQTMTDTVIARIEQTKTKTKTSPSSIENSSTSNINHSIQHIEYYEQYLPEVIGLIYELQHVQEWLYYDRSIVYKKYKMLQHTIATDINGWIARIALVEKFNPRIDVILYNVIRAITEIRIALYNNNNNNNNNYNTSNNSSNSTPSSDKQGTTSTTSSTSLLVLHQNDTIPELLWKWSIAKEKLGRLRAFVCSGGPYISLMIQQSIVMRQRLIEYIQEKDYSITRVISNNTTSTNSNSNTTSTTTNTPDVLHRMLETVTWWEWKLLHSFAPTTSLVLVHKLLSSSSSSSSSSSINNNNINNHHQYKNDDSLITNNNSSTTNDNIFNIEEWFNSSTIAIDFLLTFTKVLAASGCVPNNS